MKKKLFILLIILVLVLTIIYFSKDSENVRPNSNYFTYEEVMEAKYDRILDFNNGIAIFSINEKLGCFIEKYDETIPAIYDGLSYCLNGSLIATKDGVKGVIDLHNNVIIPFVYETIKYTGKNAFQVKKDGVNYYVNDKNEKIDEDLYYLYESAYLSEGDYKIWYSKKDFGINTYKGESQIELIGITDKEGRQIVPCNYLHFRPATDDKTVIVTSLENKEGVIKIIPLQQTSSVDNTSQ